MIQLSRDITSPVHFVELKGNRFGHAKYHPSFTAEASMALKLQKGEETHGPMGFSSRTGLPSYSVPEQCWVRKIFGPLDSMSSRPWIHWGIQEFLMEGEVGGEEGVQALIQKYCWNFLGSKLLIYQTSESPSFFVRLRLHVIINLTPVS